MQSKSLEHISPMHQLFLLYEDNLKNVCILMGSASLPGQYVILGSSPACLGAIRILGTLLVKVSAAHLINSVVHFYRVSLHLGKQGLQMHIHSAL